MAKKEKTMGRVLWIQVHKDGKPVWVNTSRLRCIEYGHGGCYLVYNTKHRIDCDETIEQVMTALGYPLPPPPPLETHETEAGEDNGLELSKTS